MSVWGWVLAIGVLVGGFWLLVDLVPLARQRGAVTEPNPPPQTSLRSFGEGGITTGNAIVNPAPRLRFQVVQAQTNYPATDGTFRTIYVGTVVTRYTARRLIVQAQAPSVQKVELRPMDSGTMEDVCCGRDQGGAFARIDKPFGRYQIEVTTAEHENELELGWTIS